MVRLDADEGDDRLDVPTPFRGGATPLSEAADATGGDDDDVLLQSAAPPRAAAASPEGLVVDVGAADRRPLVASYGSDSEDGAAAEPPPRVPPAGWAAEYDMGAAARTHAETLPDWDTQAARLLSVLGRILGPEEAK